jgi:DNA-binding XRE family transcriptional regulator
MAGREIALDKYLNTQLKNPRFRKQWENELKEKELTTRLIRLRVEQGLTQAQVAEMVGTKQTAISRLELHPPRRPTNLLRRVVALYGYEVKQKIEFVRKSA